MSSEENAGAFSLGGGGAIIDALRYRDFLALWIGQLVSQVGDQFVIIAVLVLISRLTDSAVPVGIIGLCFTAPQLLLGLWGGVFADRWNRKAVMIVSDILRGLAVLALVLVREPSQFYIVYLVTFTASAVGVFFAPARNAAIPNVVPEQLLLGANALIQGSQVIAMILGASVAGFVVDWLGIGFAFVFDALTFFVSAVAIATMRIPGTRIVKQQGDVREIWSQLKEGLAFIKRNPFLTNLMVITGQATFGFAAIFVLGIMHLGNELGIDAKGFGILYAVEGAGAVVGGVILTRFFARIRTNWVVAICMIALGVSIIAFAAAPSYALVMVSMVVIGLSIVSARAALATLTQALVPDEKRGRVESAVAMVIGAATSASTGLAGLFGDLIGVPAVFFAAGIITAAAGLGAGYVLSGAEELVANGGLE
jgi:DHA3 family macrolide efflux protein-like MFS transporter